MRNMEYIKFITTRTNLTLLKINQKVAIIQVKVITNVTVNRALFDRTVKSSKSYFMFLS